VNRLLDLIKETNLFTQEWMNVEKYNKPVAAVLGMNKTDFHVIILQSTVYTWGLWVVSSTYRPLYSGKRTALSFKSYWARSRTVLDMTTLYWTVQSVSYCGCYHMRK
jgi:hypothetical protein